MLPQNRRCFVKRSLASSAALTAPAFFTGLIRAHGEGGETTTTDPWETTAPGDTTIETTYDPFETTVEETTDPTSTTTAQSAFKMRRTDPVAGDNTKPQGATVTAPSLPGFPSDEFRVLKELFSSQWLAVGQSELEQTKWEIHAVFAGPSKAKPSEGWTGNYTEHFAAKAYLRCYQRTRLTTEDEWGPPIELQWLNESWGTPESSTFSKREFPSHERTATVHCDAGNGNIHFVPAGDPDAGPYGSMTTTIALEPFDNDKKLKATASFAMTGPGLSSGSMVLELLYESARH